MDNACLPKGCEAADRKSVFGKYEDSEMLSRLKALALNHGEPGLSRDSVRPLCNQTLRVRTFMALGDTEFPRRKRKLQQFLKDEFKPPTGFASKSSDKQSVTKLRRRQMSHGSSSSCVLNKTADSSSESLHSRNLLKSHSSGSFLTLEDNFQRQFISSEFPILNNAKDSGQPSDGSVNGSNAVTPEHISLQESIDLDDLVPSSNPLHEHLHTSRRSIRFLNSIRDHFQRMAIPVGPRFQADIPKWSGPPNKDGDSDSSHWLGTKVWPIKGQNVKSTAKSVGKGRSKSCFCVSPGSTDCIKRHILDRRLFLQSDLGPMFSTWKFDEMGEDVSKSWTLKEQDSFELLAKTNLQSSGKNFLKHAMKCFPSKSKKDIMSYYFNVFIPRRSSLQTRSELKQVDDDVDAVGDVYNLNFLKKSRYMLRG